MTGMGGNLPQSIWQGSSRVFGVEVKCHLLDTGECIIEAQSVHGLMQAMAAKVDDPGEIDEFARWQRGAA